MHRNRKKKRRGKNSVQELLGIKGFTKYGVLTNEGELIYYRVAPTNISVLSADNMQAKINKMTELLKAYPDLELCCLDAAESFDSNKAFLRFRHDDEGNSKVRELLVKDSDGFDDMQAEMATARQFMFIIRLKVSKDRHVFDAANDYAKLFAERQFEAKLMSISELKQALGLYFSSTGNGGQLPDTDGEQFFTEEFYDEG